MSKAVLEKIWDWLWQIQDNSYTDRCKSWLQQSSCIFMLFSSQYLFPLFLQHYCLSSDFTSPLLITSLHYYYYYYYITLLLLLHYTLLPFLYSLPTSKHLKTMSHHCPTGQPKGQPPSGNSLFNKSNIFFTFNMYH